MPTSETPPATALDVADRLVAAIEAGDIDAARACYAADARIWHNDTGQFQTPEENLRVLSWILKRISGLRYEEVRRQETQTGFVQQHVMRGRTRSGNELAMAGCVVATIVDGRITALDEYLDSAQAAVVRS